MSPQRIQRKRIKGWRMPAGAIYVGRPSRWGNPFRLLHDGRTLAAPAYGVVRDTWFHIPPSEPIFAYISSSHPMSIGEVVDHYASVLKCRARDEPLRMTDWLAPLVGHDLACWCPIDQPCHADVLLELANTENR